MEKLILTPEQKVLVDDLVRTLARLKMHNVRLIFERVDGTIIPINGEHVDKIDCVKTHESIDITDYVENNYIAPKFDYVEKWIENGVFITLK